MRVLILKTSSLGDLIHTLPAVTDAAAALPEIRLDWVAEEALAEIPAWHPAVARVIPIALRRWRRGWRAAWRSGEPQSFVRALRQLPYDLVIDAQGLFFKSGLPALVARGPVAGYDRRSARDPWASLCYGRRLRVPREQHAIARLRQLFAQALGYPLPQRPPDYGIRRPSGGDAGAAPYLVFLHGTAWASKQWPEAHWVALARIARDAGYAVHLPWGSPEERARAGRIRDQAGGVRLPRLDLAGLAAELAGAAGVVGLDSGLAHLAAALGVPAVTLFGPTDARLTGVVGAGQQTLIPPGPECVPCGQRHCTYGGGRAECLHRITPQEVWAALGASSCG